MKELDKALKKLIKARSALAEPQGRIARRNARRAFVGAIRSIRHQLDAEYPAIPKASPKREGAIGLLKPLKVFGFKLGAKRAWDWRTAELFLQLLGLEPHIEQGRFRSFWPRTAKYCNGRTTVGRIFCYIPLGDKDSDHWKQVIHLAAHGLIGPCNHDEKLAQKEEEVAALWRSFFVEMLPTDDLELAARHHEFLEGRRSRTRIK